MEALKEVELRDMQKEHLLRFAEFKAEAKESYMRAVLYVDVFVISKNLNDETNTSVAACYICRCTHGDQEPCNTSILNQLWACKCQEVPVHNGQLW